MMVKSAISCTNLVVNFRDKWVAEPWDVDGIYIHWVYGEQNLCEMDLTWVLNLTYSRYKERSLRCISTPVIDLYGPSTRAIF